MEISELDDKNVSSCSICGSTTNLKMIPFRTKDSISGWIFVCNDHLQLVQGKKVYVDSLCPKCEQLQIQLEACSIVALYTPKNPIVYGARGWSKAYQDVLYLRQQYEALTTMCRNWVI